VSAKYEFIDAQKAQYAMVKMCGWLGVSTSGFYEWRDRPASATARRRQRLAALTEWIYDDSDGTNGHRRIHAALVRQGERCSPELVRAIMRETRGRGRGEHVDAFVQVAVGGGQAEIWLSTAETEPVRD
jgi:hypothetical protein